MSEEEYSQDLYDRISDLLGLPRPLAIVYWKIEGHDGDVYLLHFVQDKLKEIIFTSTYTPPENITLQISQTILSMRGLGIDIETGWIVLRSFGYNATCTMNRIKGDTLKIQDHNGSYNEQPVENFTFQPFFGGTIIRLSKYRGKFYAATHKRLNAGNSKWSSMEEAETFLESFIRYFGHGCSSLEDVGNLVFDPEKPTSNFCHVFIVVSPQTLTTSRFNVGDGYLVYLRNFILNLFVDTNAPNYLPGGRNSYEISTDESLWLRSLNLRVKNIPVDESGFPIFPEPSKEDVDRIYHPVVLNQENANRFLRFGNSKLSKDELKEFDLRLHPGEAIMGIVGFSGYMVKLMPVSVLWRTYVLGNNHNLFFQFLKNLEYSKKNMKISGLDDENDDFSDETLERNYDDIYPEIGYPSPEKFKSIEKRLIRGEIIPKFYKKPKKTDEGLCRKMNIAYCFVYAVPYSYIPMACSFLEDYYEMFDSVFKSFYRNFSRISEKVENNTLEEMEGIEMKNGQLNKAGQTLKRITEQALKHKFEKRRVPITEEEEIKRNLSFLLNNESAAGILSLYNFFN